MSSNDNNTENQEDDLLEVKGSNIVESEDLLIESSKNNILSKEYIKEHKFNKSTTFLRSLIKLPLSIWDNTDLYNCYISKSKIYLYFVFKKPFTDITKFNYFLDTIATNKYYVDYVSTNKYSIVKVFIPAEYLKDIDIFLSGKYSEMSSNYKETMLSLYMKYNKSTYEIIKKGLYPSNEDIKRLEAKLDAKLSNREVISICNEEDEFFNYEEFELKEDI
jgi:hypothetical protein